MFVDLEKFNRSELTTEQKNFLERVIPWGKYIQEQTRRKALALRSLPCRHGMFASIAISDILVQSNWGAHPLALQKYKNKLSNNLAMIEVGNSSTKQKVKYEGKEFKLFDDWEHFAVGYSDHIVFSGKYDDMLCSTNLYQQQLIYGVRKNNLEAYNERIFILTSLYRLEEFDTWH